MSYKSQGIYLEYCFVRFISTHIFYCIIPVTFFYCTNSLLTHCVLKLVSSLVLIDTFLKSKIRKLSQNVVSQFKWNFDKEAFPDLREWAFFFLLYCVMPTSVVPSTLSLSFHSTCSLLSQVLSSFSSPSLKVVFPSLFNELTLLIL